jgi:hypothetical protein
MEVERMFGFLQRWFADPGPKPTYADAQFGAMPFDADVGRWYVDLPNGDSPPVRITIAGDEAPAPALLAHARDFAADLPGMLARIAAFLETESRANDPGLAQEIRALEVDSVELMWAGRPDDGMIYFRGGDDDRLWRCDYVARRPRSLGFDS